MSLLYSDAAKLLRALREAKTSEYPAKDLLRASDWPLLPRDEPHVDADLKRIHKGKPLAPILLIRGTMTQGVPLTVADGYHRICAICYYDAQGCGASAIARQVGDLVFKASVVPNSVKRRSQCRSAAGLL